MVAQNILEGRFFVPWRTFSLFLQYLKSKKLRSPHVLPHFLHFQQAFLSTDAQKTFFPGVESVINVSHVEVVASFVLLDSHIVSVPPAILSPAAVSLQQWYRPTCLIRALRMLVIALAGRNRPPRMFSMSLIFPSMDLILRRHSWTKSARTKQHLTKDNSSSRASGMVAIILSTNILALSPLTWSTLMGLSRTVQTLRSAAFGVTVVEL